MSPARIQFYQWALSLSGLLPRTPAALDGVIGTNATTAIRSYQRTKGLAVTGVFDTATMGQLDIDARYAVNAGQSPPTALPAARRPAVTGSHPTVAAIQTAATPSAPSQVVAIPPQVSQMLPPSTVAQLQTMPAPAVQSFVDDLVRKVASAENTVLSEGTGKDFTAVPVIVDGVVTAGVQQVNLAPQGWWAGLTPNERIGYGVGGAVVGVALIGGIMYFATRKGRR